MVDQPSGSIHCSTVFQDSKPPLGICARTGSDVDRKPASRSFFMVIKDGMAGRDRSSIRPYRIAFAAQLKGEPFLNLQGFRAAQRSDVLVQAWPEVASVLTHDVAAELV